MARKRVNVKFISLVAAGVLLAALAVVVYVNRVRIFKGGHEAYVKRAEKLMEEGKYKDAGKELYDAILIKGPDPELYVMLGDAWSHLVSENDMEGVAKGRGFWEQSLVVDPRYMPALQRIFDAQQEFARIRPSPTSFDGVRDAAKKVLAVDPTHLEARKALHSMTVQRWMSGVQVDQKEVDEALEALAVISKENPTDADPLFYLAAAKLVQSDELRKSHDAPGADKLLDESMKMFDDAIAAQPQNAGMYYRSAQILRILANPARKLGEERDKKIMDALRSRLSDAYRLGKVDDPRYTDIVALYCMLLRQDKKTEEAEKILRQLMVDKPYEQSVRLQLAELLATDRKRLPEAIDLLSQPIAMKPKISGIAAIAAEQYRYATQLELLKTRLEAMPTDPQQRQDQIKELDELQAKLAAKLGSEFPPLLGLRGRLEMLKGDNIAAVQSLSRAVRTMGGESDDKLLYMLYLAEANLATGQTGEAKRQLQIVLANADTFVVGRIKLIELLINERNERSLEQARKELDKLKTQLPADSPVVASLELRMLDPEKQKQEMAKLFNAMPETTLAQRAEKARIAATVYKDDDQTIRLLESIRAERPDDVELIINLTQFYLKKGQKDKASALVASGLAKNPGNIPLRAWEKRIAEASPEEMRKFRDQIVEGVGDAFAKAMLQAEAASDENRVDDAIEYLATAEKIKPDDPRMLELSFNAFLSKQDWEKAGAYMERLARANVDHSEGLHYRIQYALARGDSGRALDQAQQLVREKGEFALSWIVLGKVQAGMGNFEEASKSFLLALERQPQNVEALRGLVQCSYSLRRPDDAKRYIDRIVELQPNNPAFKEMALNHELVYGDPEKVVAARQESLKETPDELRAWQALTQTYMAAAKKKASVGDEKGANERFAKARDTAQEAFKKWPDDRGLALLIGEVSLQLKTPAEGEKVMRTLIAQPKWKDRVEPTVMLVDFYMAAGKPAEAEKELRQLIASNTAATNRPDLQIRLAELLMQQNKPDDALAVLPADSDSDVILRRRVLIQTNAGRFDAAQKDLDAMLASAATPLKKLQLLGLQVELYDRAGKYAEAQKTLDTILASDPKNAMAMLLRGKIRVQRGDYAGAMPDLIAARDALPDNTQARMLLSEAYRNRGDVDAACRELESAIRLAPTDRAARITLLSLYSQATPPRWSQAETLCKEAREIPQLAKDPAMIHAESVMWMERGDLVKSLGLVREALNAAPNDSSIARTFFEVLMRAKQYKEVIQASQKLAETRPDLWWVYQQRGLAKCRLKDKDGGLAEFELALKSASEQHDEGASANIVKVIADEIGAAQALARVQARAEKDNRWALFAAYLCQAQGDTKGAIRWVEQVVNDSSISPAEQASAFRTLGTLYAQLNPPDIAKSMAIYKQILQKQPDAVDVLNNLACVMIMPGAPATPEDALQYSRKAYDLMLNSGRPPEPAIMDTHAAILVLTGRVDEGINLLLDALDRRAFPDAFYHLGDAYLRKGQPDEAERALKSAQDLILQAEREKQPIDPTLKSKIDEALAKVPQARQQKASAGDGAK